ncbi:MAG: hypothetical protein A3C58_00755 [Candidatus Staskawiczbacteria bacterium RIFCSPHIGHO2_02_FULL_34_10]|uniref:Uncharacterized protein n=1 Tax=Candidatus Staskawiczbacteria bacterium RIFCSPHIGHO2_02_FULL_34_10 TaxID=1802205 RepID=A0A1G2HWX5_9BACT|nr:MAG: hypothetical protein A3C58_00755 [Candidatus Staskawiczbacteria bacterium RIFCSPHIGHO2_02_FULL_34_10]
MGKAHPNKFGLRFPQGPQHKYIYRRFYNEYIFTYPLKLYYFFNYGYFKSIYRKIFFRTYAINIL